jgi:hypothetical protein
MGGPGVGGGVEGRGDSRFEFDGKEEFDGEDEDDEEEEEACRDDKQDVCVLYLFLCFVVSLMYVVVVYVVVVVVVVVDVVIHLLGLFG